MCIWGANLRPESAVWQTGPGESSDAWEAFSHPPSSCVCLVLDTLLPGPSDRELLENKGGILFLISFPVPLLALPC